MKSERLRKNTCKTHICVYNLLTVKFARHTHTYRYTQLSDKNENINQLKVDKNLNRHFTKNIWITYKHKNKCSTSLIIKKM